MERCPSIDNTAILSLLMVVVWCGVVANITEDEATAGYLSTWNRWPSPPHPPQWQQPLTHTHAHTHTHRDRYIPTSIAAVYTERQHLYVCGVVAATGTGKRTAHPSANGWDVRLPFPFAATATTRHHTHQQGNTKAEQTIGRQAGRYLGLAIIPRVTTSPPAAPAAPALCPLAEVSLCLLSRAHTSRSLASIALQSVSLLLPVGAGGCCWWLPWSTLAAAEGGAGAGFDREGTERDREEGAAKGSLLSLSTTSPTAAGRPPPLTSSDVSTVTSPCAASCQAVCHASILCNKAPSLVMLRLPSPSSLCCCCVGGCCSCAALWCLGDTSTTPLQWCCCIVLFSFLAAAGGSCAGFCGCCWWWWWWSLRVW